MAGVVLVIAGFLRLHDLTRFPPGLHGDEAITGIEGRRILAEGWIGPYSPLALGQPSGPLYLTAVSVWLLGDTVLAVRMVPALLSTLTVLAFYVVCRLGLGPRVAVIAAALLAVMGWHVHFARIGFPLSAWPFAVVVAVGLLLEAIRRRDPRWWALAGAALGAGIYAYHAHLLVLGVVGLFAAASLLLTPATWSARGEWLAAFGAALAVVALPMARFAAEPANGYFNHARLVSVFHREPWMSIEDPSERAAYLGERYLGYWREVCCAPRFDGVDATGLTPLVPPAMLILAAGGAILGIRHGRNPLLAFAALAVLALPLAAVGTVDGAARRTFAVAPVLALLAAVGIVGGAGLALRAPAWIRYPLLAALLVLTGTAVSRNVSGVFGTLPESQEARWVFAHELAEASRFMHGLPDDTYVYFLSDRWSIDYETRRFLAPEVRGEDRSREFGDFGYSVDPAHDRPVFVLVGTYRELIDPIRQRYPGGTTIAGGAAAAPTFVAYVPPSPDDPVTIGSFVPGDPLGAGRTSPQTAAVVSDLGRRPTSKEHRR